MADDPHGGIGPLPIDDTGFRIRFLSTQEQKSGRNQMHLDLAPPADGDQHAEVDRLVSLGATRLDIGQGEVSWVVMPTRMAMSSAAAPR